MIYFIVLFLTVLLPTSFDLMYDLPILHSQNCDYLCIFFLFYQSFQRFLSDYKNGPPCSSHPKIFTFLWPMFCSFINSIILVRSRENKDCTLVGIRIFPKRNI